MLKPSALRTSYQSHEAYRYQLLQNAVREHEICAAFRALRSKNIEPILLKGWSVARLYPDLGRRTLGDIDLLVLDHELRIANTVCERENLYVDWHKLSERRAEFAQPEDIVVRSEAVHLLGTDVRVLCPEDNLAFVAIHMLRHGGWSPHWITDVAVLLESRSSAFEWKICLGDEPIRAGWVLSALVLTHQLVGADITGTPAENYKVPDWMSAAVLKAWADPDPANNQPPESIWTALAHPWRLPHGIRKRWPNPITAAIQTGVPFEKHHPFVNQIRYCAGLAGGFLRRASQ